jgi:ParB family chromosome partitioning protein
MTATDNNSPQPQLIAATRLEKSPHNARRTGGKAGMDELKASIAAHGLLQNLVVTDAGNGMFRVIAGGRRLEAIRALQAEGTLAGTFAVPCQVVTEERALEMSLAENAVRLAMHPADQFEAFAALIEQGETAAGVAQRFGIDEALVHKRMKLARVAPAILREYRNDAITLECVMAFTVTDDHRRQVKAYKSLPEWQKTDPAAIRNCLTDRMVEASSKLARFVGLDAYTAAGGATRRDLFGDEVYLEQPAILSRLADEKLAQLRAELEAEGWGWVEVTPERDWEAINRCGRIQPRLVGAPPELVDLKSRLDAEIEDAGEDELAALEEQLDGVERQLAAYVGFDDTQKQLAGCCVSIGQDGTAFLDKGLVKPEHRKQLAKLLGTEQGDDKPVKPKNPLPESLRRDLAAYRLQVGQIEIAKHPAIAFDLLAFQAASRILDAESCFDGPDVLFRQHKAKIGDDEKASVAGRALEALAKSLPASWRKPKSEAARFAAFRALPQSSRLQLLAYGVAVTLQAKMAPGDGDEATAYDAALAMTGGDVAAYWRPGKETYLARVTRDQLLAIARDTLGEAWAQSRSGEKKATLVDQLARAFDEPAKHGRNPQQAEKLKTWLPAGMAFGTKPEPARAKKARQAA